MAFHPYPQLIPQVFNPGGFGPPHRLTGASPWPWVDHPASGLEHATVHALFGLAFATATPHGLTSPRTANSQAHSSKGTPSPVGEDQALTACRHTVSGTLSQPLTGALFTFPSRYWSTIGHQEVFSLTTWSWQIHTEFHGLRATRENTQEAPQFHLPDSHRLRSAIPSRSAITRLYNSPPGRQPRPGAPTTPHTQHLPAIHTCTV